MKSNEPAPREVTQLLVDWSNGDQAALAKLQPLVNAESRGLAAGYMRRENKGTESVSTGKTQLDGAPRTAPYMQLQLL